ncbi:hypothetical protein HB777_37920 (plasmid) [Mesorhizobium loti]|nr:hypothetical protein HB777_37920 [Mesorhizobium loti]
MHISGVVDPSLAPEEMKDGHRILVDEADRLWNVEQIKTLVAMGYKGAYSYECFAPSVHADENIEASLKTSIKLIENSAAQ